MRIEIADGYPAARSIRALKKCQDPREALEAAADYFERCGYGSARRTGRRLKLATGGWSGCEEVIGSLHIVVRAIAWQSSHRGGLHVYELPKASACRSCALIRSRANEAHTGSGNEGCARDAQAVWGERV